MEKCTVVCNILGLKFEVDDIHKIYQAVNEINKDMVFAWPYASVTDFIIELNLDESYYDPAMDEWGWNIIKQGEIEFHLWPGIMDNQPVLELTFVTLPIRDFSEFY